MRSEWIKQFKIFASKPHSRKEVRRSRLRQIEDEKKDLT
jgi:hypothetical protein